jgi:transcriptional regulator with XRE-family HTH domain
MIDRGKILQQYREKAGYTQAKLSEAIDVSEKTIRRWEKKLREPRAYDIKKLCEVLRVSEAELLNDPTEEGYKVTLQLVERITVQPGRQGNDPGGDK